MFGHPNWEVDLRWESTFPFKIAGPHLPEFTALAQRAAVSCDQEGLCIPPFGTPNAPFPRLGRMEGLSDIHSYPSYLLAQLLQCAQHGAVLEDHLEALTAPECGIMSSNEHPLSMPMYHLCFTSMVASLLPSAIQHASCFL